MNECTNNPCGTNSQCQDTIGSYTCTCDNGFTGTGFGDCQSMLIIASILWGAIPFSMHNPSKFHWDTIKDDETLISMNVRSTRYIAWAPGSCFSTMIYYILNSYSQQWYLCKIYFDDDLHGFCGN